MNRLTEKSLIGSCYQINDCGNDTCAETCKKVSGCEACPIKKAIDQLAEYENTGMNPGEVSAMMAHNTALIDQLRDFEEAKENGLQIEVPLEVGKTLFAIFDTFDIYGNRCFKIKKLYVKRYEYDYLKVLTIVCGDPHIDRHIRTGEYRFLEEDIGKCLFEIEKEAFLKAAMALGVKI